MAAPSYRDLQRMGDHDLIAQHDRIAESTQLGLNYYLEELGRRRVERQTAAIVRLTWIIAALTLAMLATAVVSLVAVLAS